MSIGVSFNKIFAKLGSDYKKPDAITTMNKDEYRTKAWPLPVSDLLYVGSATKRKLQRMGILTIGQLANTEPVYLQSAFGKMGDTKGTAVYNENYVKEKPVGFKVAFCDTDTQLTIPMFYFFFDIC